MRLSEALRHAIANDWTWCTISKWNGNKCEKKGVRTSTLLRMVLTYSDYAALDHDRWKWQDTGYIRCDVREVRGATTLYTTCTIDLWRENNALVVERRRKRQSYMNAILQRRMRNVEERRKEREKQNEDASVSV